MPDPEEDQKKLRAGMEVLMGRADLLLLETLVQVSTSVPQCAGMQNVLAHHGQKTPETQSELSSTSMYHCLNRSSLGLLHSGKFYIAYSTK